MFADTNDIFLLCFLLFKKKNSQQVKRSKKTCKAKGNGNTALVQLNSKGNGKLARLKEMGCFLPGFRV
ncbi:hypothetical protein MtrunA17_Chr4g0027861 [Medicago truncatula]|uniref:Uncharacterized protein n=1 Tax=Medicago truncatula TaxID=3880 RepID=A0A396I8Q9_MEDTR|nr:hypothetical protein MtrunA17_Chr4g0027861 [Medicago truncatula]